MFLGIDVSKNTLDAALIGHNDTQSSKAKHKVFSNDADSHTDLSLIMRTRQAKGFPPFEDFVFGVVFGDFVQSRAAIGN